MLLGSVSDQISQERRKIAWTKINPKLKPLAEEVYSKREGNLFGPTFLDLASKRIELDKTMSKVSGASGSSSSAPPAKRPRFGDRYSNQQDLRKNLGRGPNPSTAGGGSSSNTRRTSKTTSRRRNTSATITRKGKEEHRHQTNDISSLLPCYPFYTKHYC